MSTRRLLLGLAAVLALVLPAGAQPHRPAATATTVLVNTNAADFTVVAAVAGQRIKVRHLDVQNIGTGAKVTLLLCDGTCGTAANVKYSWQLSPATASAQGGGWTAAYCSVTCEWVLTAGNALIARVDTGATNNVRITTLTFTE